MKLSNSEIDDLNKMMDTGYVRKSLHPKLPLSIYNYTQKTQFDGEWNAITRKTRGLVLDDTYDIIIKCPEKFFNQGEPLAPKIDLANARISKKLDGYYIAVKLDLEWGLIITSRGSFSNKYVEAAKKFITDEVLLKMVPEYTYFCELCQNFPGDENIILTKHPIPTLVCWAIRDGNFNEVIPDDECPFPIAQELSLAQAKEYLKQKVEGVVAQDLSTYERVKIKTEYFVQNHRLISDCTKKRVWEALSNYQKLDELNIPDEFIPQIKRYEKEIGQEFDAVWRKIQDANIQTSHLTDKELGLLDDYQDLKPFLFLLRKDKRFECWDKIWQKIKP